MVAPGALEGGEAGVQGLALDDVDGPRDDVVEVGAGGGEGGPQVGKDLVGLGANIARADDGAIGVDGVLAADVDRLDIAGNGDDVREGRALRQAIGVQVLDAPQSDGARRGGLLCG